MIWSEQHSNIRIAEDVNVEFVLANNTPYYPQLPGISRWSMFKGMITGSKLFIIKSNLIMSASSALAQLQ